MKSLLELTKKLSTNNISLQDKYPELATKKDKHILFVNPVLTGDCYYKMILPAMEINDKSATMSCIISSISKFDPSKPVSDYEMPIDTSLIAWADYVVFPFTDQQLYPIYDNIRVINRNAKVAFNVDYDFTLLPETHPDFNKMQDQDKMQNVVANANEADLILISNPKLGTLFGNKEIALMPLFVSDFTYEGWEPNKSQKKDKLRIGIVANQTHAEDIKSIIPYLKKVKDAEIVIFGFNGKHVMYKNKMGNYVQTDKNHFKDFEHTYQKPVDLTKYFQTLFGLNIDIGLIPIADNDFNRASKNYLKYLEFGFYNIPCIISQVEPYTKLITDNSALLVGENWIEAIDHLRKEDFRKQVGNEAATTVAKKFEYNNVNIRIFDSIFV